MRFAYDRAVAYTGLDFTSSVAAILPVRSTRAIASFWVADEEAERAAFPTGKRLRAIPPEEMSLVESVTVQTRADGVERGTHLTPALRQIWSVARWLLLLVPVVQIALLLWLIWNRTLDVPVNDEWSTVELVWRANHGVLRWTDFWEVWNDHRLVLPRLIDLILIKLTRWNPQVEMTFDLGIAIASASLLFHCVRRTFGSINAALALTLPVSLLFFSFSQLEDWLVPFQIPFFLTTLGVALCTWALTTQGVGPGAFSIAVLGALIASLSVANGLFTWVAFLPVLWLAGYRNSRYFAIWGAAALAIIIPYSIGFPSTPHTIDVFASLHFALVFLGAPVGYPDLARAQAFGAISILLMAVSLLVYWLRTRDLRAIAGWLGLALFALACMASGAWVRGPVYGIEQAITSRYHMFSDLWWVALTVITALNVSHAIKSIQNRPHHGTHITEMCLAGAGLVALLLLCVFMAQINRTSFAVSTRVFDMRRANEGCILNYREASDDCLRLFLLNRYEPAFVRTLVADLDQHHLSIFRLDKTRDDDLAPTTQATRYAIENVGNTAIVQPHQEPIAILGDTTVRVRGWAVDEMARRPAGGVLVVLDGAQRIRAEYGGNRADVAKALGNANYGASGFSATIDRARLTPGRHSLAIAIITNDGTQVYQAPQTVTIQIEQRSLGQLTRLPDGIFSSIDTLTSSATGQIVVARPYKHPIRIPVSVPIIVSGWAIDTMAQTGAGNVFLSIDGTTDLPTIYGFDRSDVASGAGNDTYLPSGYTVVIPARTLAPGKHVLTLKIAAKDLRGYAESSQSVEVEIAA